MFVVIIISCFLRLFSDISVSELTFGIDGKAKGAMMIVGIITMVMQRLL